MGDGKAEGSSAIGDGGQAAMSLTPDVDVTGSGSAGFSSTCPLENTVLVVSEFCSSCHNDMVALGCILNGCCKLCELFYIQVQCLRNLTGALKENPFTISCITKLFSASVTSSSCLSLCFLWASSSFRSSLVNSSCCIATSSMRLSSCRSSLK